MWLRFEPYHDVTYFTPESRAAVDALGVKGGWMGYFAMRAAPLGAASPEQVTSAFYNFHSSLVSRALPEAWRIAAPERYLAARLTGAGQALRRLLGEQVVAGPEVAEAAKLAVEAAGHASTAGRPMAAANAVLPSPDQPHLALWQAATVLRESRGDGHIAALISAGLDPTETLVIFATERGLGADYLRKARAWPEADWQAAGRRLVQRGLLDGQGALTEEGAELRRWVEERTDAAAAAPWLALGEDRTERLVALLTPIARVLGEGNDAMRTNPMALDVTTELAAEHA